MLIETKATDYTREQKRDILEVFNQMYNKIDRVRRQRNAEGRQADSKTEAGILLKTLCAGEEAGVSSAQGIVYETMEELRKELYSDHES